MLLQDPFVSPLFLWPILSNRPTIPHRRSECKKAHFFANLLNFSHFFPIFFRFSPNVLEVVENYAEYMDISMQYLLTNLRTLGLNLKKFGKKWEKLSIFAKNCVFKKKLGYLANVIFCRLQKQSKIEFTRQRFHLAYPGDASSFLEMILVKLSAIDR